MKQSWRKPENILSMINILVTIIVGVVVALVIQFRSEELQKNLINLQVEADLKSVQAKIVVETFSCIEGLPYVSCSQGVFIQNRGLANAKNVNMIVAIDEISDTWKDYVDDINKFSVTDNAPQLGILVKPVKINTKSLIRKSGENIVYEVTLPGNNAYEVTIPNLPPNSDVYFSFDFSTSQDLIPVYFENLEINVRNTADGSTNRRDFSQYEYFEGCIKENLIVSTFETNYTCDNCTGIDDGHSRFSILSSSYLSVNNSNLLLDMQIGETRTVYAAIHVQKPTWMQELIIPNMYVIDNTTWKNKFHCYTETPISNNQK